MKIKDLLTNYTNKSVSTVTPIQWCNCGCGSCGGYHRGKVRVDTSEGDTMCTFCKNNLSFHDGTTDDNYSEYLSLISASGNHDSCTHCENCEQCMGEYDDQYSCNDNSYCESCYGEVNCSENGKCPACDWCDNCREFYDSYSHNCGEENND